MMIHLRSVAVSIITLLISGLSSVYPMEDCDSGPCLNAATCIQQDTSGFTCLCTHQYTGEFCEISTEACYPDSCYNGGTCLNDTDGFKCICTEHFLGRRCEAVRRYCMLDNHCQNEALCEDIHSGGYTCYCIPGYYGDHCESEINECVSSPCSGIATCRDEVNGYTCLCPPGTAGSHCEVEVNDGCSSGPCVNGATCVDGTLLGQYACTCVTGFTGVNCNINIDDCLLIVCGPNHVCTDIVDGYRCDCMDGRSGESCDIITDACIDDPCQNSATCVHEDDRYVCDCPHGFAGVNCEIQTNACFPDPCFHEATCVTNYSVAAGFKCLCSQDFVGERCEGKVASCLSFPCLHNGSCIENINTAGYTCECSSNFTGARCENSVGACMFTGCKNGGSCVVNGSGYECQCVTGWSGMLCDADVNECRLSPCHNGGQCINVLGSYVCLCGAFWTGGHCDMDETECSVSPCRNNGTCIEVEGGPPQCLCEQDATGELCETRSNGCDPDPCSNGARCLSIAGNYTCQCEPGFQGTQCEMEIYYCESEPCKNNATCVHLTDGFICQCIPGFQGTLCEEEINDCDPNPCRNGSTCLDRNNEYFCVCVDGYEGKNCSVDVDECASSPCLQNGTCTQPVVNGHQCDCMSGVYGDHCQTVSIATFDGSSLVKLSALADQEREVSMDIRIRFWFSTSILEGILFVTTGMSDTVGHLHLLIEMVRGRLVVSGNMYGETLTNGVLLLTHNQVISNYLSIVITTSHTNVSLNDCSEGQANNCHMTFAGKLSGENVIDTIMIGGVGDVSPYLRSKLSTLSPFIGCIGNFTVNGKMVSLIPETDQMGVAAGCRSHDLCEVNMCENGGQCMDMWSSSRCKCTPGFQGSVCEHQISAEFLQQSFMHFGDFSKVTNISLWITVNSLSGVIVYTLDHDLVSLYVDKGELLLHLVVNGNDFVKRVGSLESGDWFHVSAQFGQGIYRISLSHEENATTGSATTGSASGTVGNSLDVYTPMFMGRLHEHPAVNKWRDRPLFKHDTSFSGCILNLTINNEPVDFRRATSSVFGNDPVSARPGCSRDDACALFPCHHGGSCIPAWNTTRCQCTPSFTGPHCEIAQPATFNGGTSYIELQLNTSLVPFGDSGSFEFRTRDETATLMYIQFYSAREVNTSLELSLYRTNLHVTLSSDNSTRLVFNATVSDGEWHAVHWVRSYDLITVNHGSRSLSTSVKFDPFIFEPLVKVFMGAKPYQPDESDFMIGLLHGCIRNVTFNDNNVQYLEDLVEDSRVIVYTKEILAGCHGDDSCVKEPCPNNSACEDIWNGRICSCLNGWEGSACNMSVDDCVNNSCVRGHCVDGHEYYTCVCDAGYTGLLCDTVYDACLAQPCFNEGVVNCTPVFPAQFECLCKSGWFGITCAEEINECESSPCLNDGRCTDLVNDFECECENDYFGKICGNVRICSSLPCYNGGTCVSEMNNTVYSCSCLKRYSGLQCQTYNFCYENMCERNASCVSGAQGYTCDCLRGHYGAYCQFMDYCASEPCLNDAVCHSDIDTFRCSCTELFSGDTCEIPVNRCEQNVCQNGATCFFNSSDVPSSYVCNCVEGFSGLHCETDIDECASEPCQNRAACIESNQQPWKFFPGFHCECMSGYYGDQCETEINECENVPCENNGTCLDLVNKFECQCVMGFAGDQCEIDDRGCSSDPCHNNGKCVESGNTGYTCVCNNGYEGILCEIDVDNCVNNACVNGGICKDGIDSYTCVCPPGYSGEFCQSIKDACFSQPCYNNGTCLFRGLCDCEDVIESCGWHNETCQTDVCSQTQGCSLHSVAYTCSCGGMGYEGDICFEDVDECNLPSPCEHSGICVNTVGSYTCDCKDTGYVGRKCEQDIDECNGPSPCYNGGVCKNLFGSFRCLCGAGWSGETCGELIDSCQGQPCDNGGNCINTLSGYVCDCTGSGFQGYNCDSNINNCVGRPCLNNGHCIDGISSFSCDCNATGYHGDLCEVETDDCATSPCENNGTCVDTGLTYKCTCRTGYSGVNCTTDVNECTTELDRCIGQANCINTVGSYVCVCSEEYTGVFCEIWLTQSDDTGNTGVVAASVVIIIAIIIALVVYLYWYMRKSRRMKGRYKPSQMERTSTGFVPGIPLDKIIDPATVDRLI